MKNNIFLAIKLVPTVFSILNKSSKKYIFVMLLETIAFSIDKYPALFIMKYTIEALTLKISYDLYIKTVIILMLLMLCIKLIKVVVNTYRPICDQIVTEKLFSKYFAKCMTVDFQIYESTDFKNQMEMAKYMANGKIAAIGWYFVDMFSSLIALVIATVMLTETSLFMIGVCLLGFVFKVYSAKKALNKTVPITKEQIVNDKYLNYLYNIASDFDYAKDFRIYNYEDKIKNKLQRAKKQYFKTRNKIQKIDQKSSLLHSFVDFAVKIFSFLTLGWKCMNSIISVGDFTFSIGIVNNYIAYAQTLVSSCTKYIEASEFIKYYTSFISEETQKTNEHVVFKAIETSTHVLEFKNVSFKYPSANVYALENINVRLETPFRVSLVGENGAGKSTFIKLLLRLYKPTIGEITLDGINIFDYSEKEYMNLVSSVFQDFALFAFTVKENISSFNAINKSILNDVSLKTGVSEFVEKRPDMFDTYLTNEFSNFGYDFSGGERQKIALARSMYKQEAIIYILDEPTSTYDAFAEYRLYKQYNELIKNKSSIYISHRLSSCKLSDVIILLENGKIIEIGTHEKLMDMDGKYRKMYDLQYEKYREGVI